MLKKSLLYIFAAMTLVACSSDDNEDSFSTNANANSTKQCAEYGGLEFPRLNSDTKNNVVLVHKSNGILNYCVEWDMQKKSQRWSCYKMYKSIMASNVDRFDAKRNNPNPSKYPYQYPLDPILGTKYPWSVGNGDGYYRSGYDHGHICPSADRLMSFEQNYQTFYLTNMQPQKNGFNAKVWANMEKKVRDWAKSNNYKFCDTMYVCKGGTIDNKSQIAGTINGHIIPKYFFMAILISKKQSSGNVKYDAMAFWIEHKNCTDNNNALKKYVITIDELEKKTGIDFFCNLPDNIEKKVESTVDMKLWGFN